MAKDSSFDIVSIIAMNEVENAINQARREATTRYDLKKASCVVELDGASGEIKLTAAEDMALKSLVDIVKAKLVHRGVDIKALHMESAQDAARGERSQKGSFVQGISKDIARDINKLIKQEKLKVNTQIQESQVRVSAKKRDDLQEAIRLVKSKDFGIPLQFINLR